MNKLNIFLCAWFLFFCSRFGDLKAIPERLAFDAAHKNHPALSSLLQAPLDLQRFKKLKKSYSNSGGAGRTKYFYKPDYKGFYWSYFLFDQDYENGPAITTYKKGKEMGGYMDRSEVLIQVFSDRPDKDLGRCDLVNKDSRDLRKLFGERFIKKGDYWAYEEGNTLLLLKIKRKVEWFKIVRLNQKIDDFETLEKTKLF